MTGKVYPEGIAWDSLANDYIAEFGDLADIERLWSQYKSRHHVLAVFTCSAAEIMKASFAELVAISQQFRGDRGDRYLFHGKTKSVIINS